MADGVAEVRPTDPLARVMARSLAEVEPGVTLAYVAEVLAAGELGAVPVMSGDRLVGVLSERDVVAHVALGADLSHLTAGDVMTVDVVTSQHSDSIMTAAHLMCEAGVRHLPVLMGRDVAGIVSMRDLLQVLVDHELGAAARPTSGRHGVVASALGPSEEATEQ